MGDLVKCVRVSLCDPRLQQSILAQRLQNKDADGRGKADIVAASVDLGGKLVQGQVARQSEAAKFVPELRLERHRGAVAAQG